jgi:NAD(P)-dependent dehydrogenase (short-subunit alcohol dehydrogenase family)
MGRFTGNVLLITGAASGIGKATAIEFARNGVTGFVLNDVNPDALEVTSQELIKMGCKTLCIKADVSNAEEVKAMVEKTIDHFGKIDILANIAGTAVMGTMDTLEISDWRRVLDVNLMGMIYTCRYVYPYMLKQSGGRIINVASAGGLAVFHPYLAPYNTSKFAAVGFSEALMQEALPRNIIVTCVCPGAVITPIYDTAIVKGFKPGVKDKFSESLLHTGELPEKTAKAIVKASSHNQFLLVTTPFANLMYFIRLCFAFAWFPLMKIVAKRWETYFKQYRL